MVVHLRTNLAAFAGNFRWYGAPVSWFWSAASGVGPAPAAAGNYPLYYRRRRGR